MAKKCRVIIAVCCHAAQVNLDAGDERNKEDLEAFIGALLDDVFEAEPAMARGKAAAELAQRSDGLFQYAGFVARELEQLRKVGDSKLTLDAMLDMFPADLDKLYHGSKSIRGRTVCVCVRGCCRCWSLCAHPCLSRTFSSR